MTTLRPTVREPHFPPPPAKPVATQAPAAPEAPAPVPWAAAEWAGKAIPYEYVAVRTFPRTPGAIRTGPEGVRADDQAAVKALVSDFSTGGLFKRVGDITRDLNRYDDSDGLIAHIPNYLGLPYYLYSQQISGAADPTSHRTNNVRVHGCSCALGTTGLRLYTMVNKDSLRDTSLTDPSLTRVEGFTDSVRSLREIKKNNTSYLVAGFNGATDDVKGTLDPTASPPAWTTIFSLQAGDQVDGIETFAQIASGFNFYYGMVSGVEGLYYDKYADALGTAPVQMVDAASKDIQGILPTVSVGPKFPTVVEVDASVGTLAWSNPSRLTASDNSYATFTTTAASQQANALLCRGFDLTSVPLSAVILGILVELERKESNTNDDIFTNIMRLKINGSFVTLNRAPASIAGGAAEWPIADAFEQWGGSTDNWGVLLTGQDVQTLAVYFQAASDSTAVGAGVESVDSMRVTVTYRLGGATLAIPRGGQLPRKLPSNPTRLPIIAPIRSEAITVNLPRELWFCDVSYDTSNDRLLGTLSKPGTGLVHVEWGEPHSGGLALGGDSAGGAPGKVVKLMDSSGQIRDLGYLSGDGYRFDVGTTAGISVGRVLIVESARIDGTDSQWWYYFDGVWHASSSKQSKSSIQMTGLPLGWAETAINVKQQFRYRFFVSGTTLCAAREFQPRNIFEDPSRNNTTQPKMPGPHYLTMPRLNWGGAFEANKAIEKFQYGGRELGATLGSVSLDFEVDGDTTFSDPAVSHTFTSAYEAYAVPDCGVALREAILRIGVIQGTDSTKSPDVLPLLAVLSTRWLHLYEWTFFLHMPEVLARYHSIMAFLEVLKAASTTDATYVAGTETRQGKVVQKLRVEATDWAATLEAVDDLAISPVPVGLAGTVAHGKPFLRFLQAEGSAT